jgi:ribosome biogenesis GTPase
VNLEQFGWNEFFSRQLSPGEDVAGVAGRVSSVNREGFVVWTEAGEVDAEVSGAMRQGSQLWPAVGDWVVLRPNYVEGAVIERVLERRTKLSRKQPEREMREQVLAANIDVLFIVSGLDRDYNPRRLERYLVMARESGARPVILLNKADLAGELGLDLDEVIRETRVLAGDATVLPVSALEETGLDALGAEMGAGESVDGESVGAAVQTAARTAAMIGSSGVGKSTILNRLLGDERQRTFAVREGDSRGRHTTVTRELFRMPGGWLLIDMPGLREVQLWAAPEGLDESFEDIQALAAGCRFRDCTHENEPGCAVLAAGLDAGRMENYKKMRRELAHLERKADPILRKELRAKWNATERSVRNHPKRNW